MDLTALSLEQKIGQALCLGWSATDAESAACLNAHAREIVQAMGAGAVILMGRNAGQPAQTRKLVAELQGLASIPLFVAVDQEGGMVNRFAPPLHQFPGSMALGAIANSEAEGAMPSGAHYVRRQARAQARELRAVGVNWNFAPVVDVNNNPDNPIIGVRSYGENPAYVAALGVAAAQGYQSEGVLACAKHFPGHGDTSVDSHLALPTVTGSRDRLDSMELLPFRALIAAGAGAIMTTHILFPALDSERPATLSPAVLTGLLREQMGYDGLVITDCLEMNAIADTVGTAQGALLALQAGADMALICHTLETQRQTRQVLLDAVHSGALPVERLNEAVRRILAAKQQIQNGVQYGVQDGIQNNIQSNIQREKPEPQAGDEQEGDANESTPAYLDPAHDVLEKEIARASITVVRQNALIPLRLAPTDGLLVLSGHSAGQRLTTYLKGRHENTSCLIWKRIDADFRAQAQALAERAKAVIIASMPPEAFSRERVKPEEQAAFVRELHVQWGEKLIVAALREPYDLRHFPDVLNYVCTYGHRPCSLEAIADALFGAYTPTGKLPVTIPNASQSRQTD